MSRAAEIRMLRRAINGNDTYEPAQVAAVICRLPRPDVDDTVSRVYAIRRVLTETITEAAKARAIYHELDEAERLWKTIYAAAAERLGLKVVP